MKIVKVKWLDAFSDNMDWVADSVVKGYADDSSEVLIEQVGYQYSKTKKYLVLAMAHCNENSTYSGIFKIPIKMIIDYQILEGK